MNATISIVIVNWNTRDLTTRCIQSIKEHKGDLSVEAIVVDNDSSDGSEAQFREVFAKDDWVTVIQSGANLGFGKGCNVGIKRSRATYVFILNPDTEVFEDTLRTLYSYMETHKEVAIVAPKLENPDGTLQESIRRFPTANDQSVILLKLHHFVKNLEPIERYLATDFNYTQEADVEQPMGAALFFRRSVLTELGGFDERYFLWFEEVDLLKQVHDRKDWKIRYLPTTRVLHHKGQSFGQLRALKEQHILNTSMLKYFAKNRPPEEYFLILALMPVSYALAVGVQFLEWINILPNPKKRAGSKEVMESTETN
ncbi:MAG: glycosyltransferase family 2 protein [Candidatus Doudnabacteria bacterium]|nr:glycosyltransferase family 2 protein [Candidatus Doudnabacteria bacterium]